jgi:Domain of unknown function (DUF5664)
MKIDELNNRLQQNSSTIPIQNINIPGIPNNSYTINPTNPTSPVDLFEQGLKDNFKQALRYNEGKLQWSMIDFKSLEGMVRVLEMGAKKYGLTKKLDVLSLFQLCQESQFVTTVKLVKELSHEGFVQHVIDKQPHSMVLVKDVQNIDQLTKSLFVEPVMSTSEHTLLVRKEKRLKNTKTVTDNVLNLERKNELEVLKEWKTPLTERKVNEEISYGDLLTTESLKSFIHKSVLKDVKFVGAQQDYILTMIIQLENTEVFCVASATTPLGCLMTILNYLKKELIISKSFNLEGNNLKFPGKDNWKLGMPVTQVCESLMRHLFAYMSGEDTDPESGESHMSHVLVNAMFVEYIMKERSEFDDRKKD